MFHNFPIQSDEVKHRQREVYLYVNINDDKGYVETRVLIGITVIMTIQLII